LLDTAPAYGSSEQRLGRLLTDRQDWVICTKVGEEFLNGKSYYDFSETHVRHSVERSLRNLNTDYLDIVLVHSDGNDMHIIESTACLPTLMDLKEKGLIRAVGMSTKSLDGGLKAVELSDLVMVTYNPSTTDDAEVIRYANSLNKGVLIKKALNSGHVATAGENSIENNLIFALTPAGVSSVIVGTISPEHLRENVESVVRALA
jgi:aryl-alcohol dehydrogenase-like predicted oxidoreductase